MNKTLRFFLKNGQIINADMRPGECDAVFKLCREKGTTVELFSNGHQTASIRVDELAAVIVL